MTNETPTGPTIDHASYMGGTDIASILGQHPYRTALDVWAEKVHGIGTEENERMKIGKVLERPILQQLYAAPRNLWLFLPGTHRHPSEPWMAATPDAIAGQIVGTEHRDLDRLAECKIVGHRQARRWGPAEDGIDGLPGEVLTQVTWQLEAVRAAAEPLDQADIVALLGTDLRVYRIEYDREFAANLMEAGRAWWIEHVERGKMPEVYTEDSRKLFARIYPKATEGILEMTADVRDWANVWLEFDRDEKAAKIAKEGIAAQICAQIGDAKGFEGDGLRVLWSERKGSISYAKMADALSIPQATREEYRGEPTRTFRVTDNREE